MQLRAEGGGMAWVVRYPNTLKKIKYQILEFTQDGFTGVSNTIYNHIFSVNFDSICYLIYKLCPI